MIGKITSSNFYNNKLLTQTLKFASENSAIYTAGASFGFASVVRPVSTLLAPKTDKEDKKISFAKSISSAFSGFLFMSLASIPFSKAIKNIDKNPLKYLKPETIKNLSNGLNNINDSKSYKFLTQLFKLGLGFLLAYPKALVNNKIIPDFLNNDKNKENKPSFTGKVEKIIALAIDNKEMQTFANKMKNTNYTTHLIALGDIFSTFAFMNITSKNKKLSNHQKKVLNYNSLISTGLCLAAGYSLDKISDKNMDKFIKNLTKANKNSPDLAKYIEGSKIIKTSLIFGLVYYGLIPIFSTYLSSKLAKNNNDEIKK